MGAENLANTGIRFLDLPAHGNFSKLYITIFCYFYRGGALAMSGQPLKCSCRLQVMMKD